MFEYFPYCSPVKLPSYQTRRHSMESQYTYPRRTRLTVTGGNNGGETKRVALVETLALGSVAKSIQKTYVAN